MLMSRVLVVLASLLVLAACGGGQAKADRDDLQRAHALFADAEKSVREGNLEGASERYREATSLLDATQLRAKRPGADELPEGPIYLGKSARAWGEEWKQTFADDIKQSFDVIRQSAVAGGRRWYDARDFIANYGGRELEQRWLDAAGDIEKAAAGRVHDQIVFLCECTDAAYCGELRALLAPRLVRPITNETASIAVNAAAFAVVTVDAKETLEEYAQTGGANSVGTVAVTSIPKRLDVTIRTEPHQGPTSWDGTRTLSVEVPLPASFQWVNETAKAQTQALREKMMASLQQLAPQTLAP